MEKNYRYSKIVIAEMIFIQEASLLDDFSN
jgi:hypothetical protein